MLDRVCATIGRRQVGHTLRVCVDGPDAAGKTTLADELAVLLGPARPVIRLSIDRFHRPAELRRRLGSLSPHGYYADSFDNEAVVEHVLKPLGPGGDGRYLTASFDYRSDTATPEIWAQAPGDAVLLFDGVFLLRPELRGLWDVTLYLAVDPEESLARARVRDVELFGSVQAVEERYRLRYLPGQELYRAQADPAAAADMVLDMNDPAKPRIIGR